MPVRRLNAADAHKEQWMEQAWQCYELRVRGLSLRAIGKTLGINHQTVANRLEMANRAIVLPGVEAMRKQEDERMDNLLMALEGGIRRGDAKSIEAAIKLLERRAKLWGLDKPAELNVTVHEIDERDRELAEMTREWMTKRHADDAALS